MSQRSEKVDGVYFIVSIIDALMCAGEFNAVDIILKNSMREGISITFLVALAAATLPAKSRLAQRTAFMEFFREYTKDGEDQEELLRGLE